MPKYAILEAPSALGHVAVGLQIAIYNPDFGPDGSNGRGLAATIRSALVAGAAA
jgi:hypothetical protein